MAPEAGGYFSSRSSAIPTRASSGVFHPGGGSGRESLAAMVTAAVAAQAAAQAAAAAAAGRDTSRPSMPQLHPLHLPPAGSGTPPALASPVASALNYPHQHGGGGGGSNTQLGQIAFGKAVLAAHAAATAQQQPQQYYQQQQQQQLLSRMPQMSGSMRGSLPAAGGPAMAAPALQHSSSVAGGSVSGAFRAASAGHGASGAAMAAAAAASTRTLRKWQSSSDAMTHGVPAFPSLPSDAGSSAGGLPWGFGAASSSQRSSVCNSPPGEREVAAGLMVMTAARCGAGAVGAVNLGGVGWVGWVRCGGSCLGLVG